MLPEGAAPNVDDLIWWLGMGSGIYEGKPESSDKQNTAI